MVMVVERAGVKGLSTQSRGDARRRRRESGRKEVPRRGRSGSVKTIIIIVCYLDLGALEQSALAPRHRRIINQHGLSHECAGIAGQVWSPAAIVANTSRSVPTALLVWQSRVLTIERIR